MAEQKLWPRRYIVPSKADLKAGAASMVARSMTAAAIRKRERVLLVSMLVVFCLSWGWDGKWTEWPLFKHFFCLYFEDWGVHPAQCVYYWHVTTHQVKGSDENKSRRSRQNSSDYNLWVMLCYAINWRKWQEKPLGGIHGVVWTEIGWVRIVYNDRNQWR